MTDTPPSAAPAGPVIRIERGHLTSEELAALAAVLTAAAASAPGNAPAGRARGWSSRHRVLNPGTVRGAGWGAR